MKPLLSASRLLLLLTLLTGLLYPLAVWAFGRAFFRDAAAGSLLHRDDRVVGSALLAQKTTDPRYFWPRPSAGDYATVPSGAGNRAWTSSALQETVATHRATGASADSLTASGSGLDPHISVETARGQAERVAAARRFTPAQRDALIELIARHTEGGQFSPARLNVLALNLALDSAFASP